MPMIVTTVLVRFFCDFSVVNGDNAVRLKSNAFVMGDDNERLPVFLVGNLEKVYDLSAVFGVKISCRLIGKHHRGRIHQSPTDGYSLLLTAGKLIRQVVFTTG